MYGKKYTVIEILNEATILINYGYNNNAQKGDVLRIIEKGEPVIYKNVDYGTLDRIKAVVKVVTPYEKFSICQQMKTLTVVNPLSQVLQSIGGVEEYKTTQQVSLLNVDKTQITHKKMPALTPVKTGDTAILLKETVWIIDNV